MKSMKKGISLVVIAGYLLTACNTNFSNTADAKKFIEDKDNGLRKEIRVDRIVYCYQYKPTDYMMANEAGDEDPAAQEQRKKDLDQMWWFNVELSVADFNQSPLRYQLTSMEEYQQRQDYMLNYAPRDFALIADADTLHPASYWFENNQNLTPHETVVLAFEKPKQIPEEVQLVFNDQLFRNGMIKATFETKKLNKQINITR